MYLIFPLCQKDFTKLQDHINNLSTQRESQSTLLALMDTILSFYKMSQKVWVKIFVKSLRKKFSKITLCLDWLMFCWKKIVYGLLPFNIYFHLFFSEEIAIQLLNMLFALDFLLMTMILVQELTGNLLLSIKAFTICQLLL